MRIPTPKSGNKFNDKKKVIDAQDIIYTPEIYRKMGLQSCFEEEKSVREGVEGYSHMTFLMRSKIRVGTEEKREICKKGFLERFVKRECFDSLLKIFREESFEGRGKRKKALALRERSLSSSRTSQFLIYSKISAVLLRKNGERRSFFG